MKEFKNNTDKFTNYKLPCTFLFGIKIIKYRIVKDVHAGFECQKWRIWLPFWIQMNYVNTHDNIEKAINYIENDGKVVLES